MSRFQTVLRPLTYVPAISSYEKTITTTVKPDLVVIPLEYPGQVLYQPVVQAGDTVRKNQIIGKSALGNCVHASISGVVKEVKSIWTARSYNVPAVIIEANDEPALTVDEVFESYGILFNSASHIEKLKVLGVVSPWTRPGKHHREEETEGYPEVKKIIIKGVSEEPSIFAFELLLQQQTARVIQGIKLLNNISPHAEIWLTMPKQLTKWAGDQFGDSVHIAGISDSYKQRIERLVVPHLTGIDIPNTASYRQKGIAVLSVECLLAIVDAIEGDGPFIYKHVTVAGDMLSQAVTVKIPIGTPIQTVLEQLGFAEETCGRILVGGPMKGIAQYSTETPLTKSSHGLYLMLPDSLPDEINLTCFNCGRCTHACPINLQVHLIGRYVEHDLLQEAKEFHPEACNECGLCAYVCPAHRPLVQLIQMCNRYDELTEESIER